MKYIVLFLWFLSYSFSSLATVEVTDLQCGYMDNPLGIELDNLSFNWIIKSLDRDQRQTAYQIIIASDIEHLNEGVGDVWDSGTVTSGNSGGVKYAGPALLSATEYFWKVRVWDRDGTLSDWSSNAFFTTGFLYPDDWSGSKWIGYEDLPDSLLLIPGVHGSGNKLGPVALRRPVVPMFRKPFQLNKKVKKAFVFISGMGQYELSLNGEKTGNRFLAPGWTDYRKSVLYNAYDVTDVLQDGENVLGVIVGNGFFNVNRERYRKLVIAYGMPRFIMKMQIDYEDGSHSVIVSDETWKTTQSPIVFTSIYGGEDYDARKEQTGWDESGFDDALWKRVLLVKAPQGWLRAEHDYPLKVMESIGVNKLSVHKDNVLIYDFGQNASGIIQLKIRGGDGQIVKIIPGELLGEDSLVTQKASGEPYYFTYTLRGGEEEIWQPRFTYYGFRYAQVEGAIPEGSDNPGHLPEILDLKLLHTRNASPVAGSFICSNDLFNRTYKLIDWAIRSNMASVLTDCPHREKLGWLEQVHLMGNSVKFNYKIHNLLRKMIEDMKEAQLENGLVPDIAPEFVPFTGGFRDSPEWGSAAVLVPWYIYKWYGDSSALKTAYPMMKKYTNYLLGKSDGYILSHGLGDWFDLGPNSPGSSQLTPRGLTATAIFYYNLKILSRVAGLLKNSAEETYYLSLSESVRHAFNKKFFNSEIGVYATGSQTSYSMPLYFKMVDEAYRDKVEAKLVASIEKDSFALTAGDVGYRYLLRALEQAGRSDVIYKMNVRSDVPGYGYQIAKGATALTESWPALKYVSNNHMMLGHLMEWFYSGLAGIRQTEGSTGYRMIVIDPQQVGDITRVKASYYSVRGEIRSNWEIVDGKFILNVSIPANADAIVYLPVSDTTHILESGKKIEIGRGILNVNVEADKVQIHVGSGDYEFTVFKG